MTTSAFNLLGQTLIPIVFPVAGSGGHRGEGAELAPLRGSYEVGPDLRPVDIRQLDASGCGSNLDEFLLQNFDHTLCAGGAECRKPPPRRPTDLDAIGPQCERLEYVGAATDATIEQHGNPAIHGSHYLRQDFQRRWTVIHRAPAMI